MASNRMFPPRIKPYLNVELSQAQPSMNPQDHEGKNAAMTQESFQVEIKSTLR